MREYIEDACKRCDQTTFLCVVDAERRLFVQALTLPCACNGDCGAAFCGGEDAKVAG